MRGIPGPRVTVSHQRASAVSDGMGGNTTTWTTIETHTGVLQEMRGHEAVRYQKQTGEKLYYLWCDTVKPDGTARTVYRTDRYLLGTRQLDVLNPENPAEQGYFYRIALREVT